MHGNPFSLFFRERGRQPPFTMSSALFFAVGIITIALSSAVDCPKDCSCSINTVKCQGYSSVPQEFPDVSGIQIFDLSNNNLTALYRTDFVNFTNVQKLYLNGNSISTIENGTFSALSNLTFLNISSNKLEQIEDGVFCNLTELSVLSLRDNYLTHLSLDVFHNLPKLTYLYLGFNRLNSLHSSFNSLPALRELHLDNNSLTSVPSNIFNCTPGLTNLRLNLNRISNISDYSFSNLTNIKSINLDYNRIQLITAYAFEIRHQDKNTVLECKIEYFSIIGNILSYVPGALNDLVYVAHLDISDNNIQTIKPGSFYRLKNLRYLRISEMPLLSRIDPEAFSGLNLRDLFMTRNPMLKELPANLLQNMGELRTVLLNNNGLLTLPQNLCNWQQLSNVMLDDNDFICSCGIQWLKTYGGWGTYQTIQHTKTLKCHNRGHVENYLINKFDFDSLLCTKAQVATKSRVLAGLIAATFTLLTVCLIVFLVRYRKRLIFRYRQFKYRRHTDSAFTIEPKYSDLSTNGDLHADMTTTKDKTNLLT